MKLLGELRRRGGRSSAVVTPLRPVTTHRVRADKEDADQSNAHTSFSRPRNRNCWCRGRFWHHRPLFSKAAVWLVGTVNRNQRKMKAVTSTEEFWRRLLE